MRTLEDAWLWYNNVKESLKRMERMGLRYWQFIPWDQPPWRSDNHFIYLEKEVIIGSARNGLENLDDLAIGMFFSVFEALVRGTILEQIIGEESRFQHPVIAKAITTAKE